MNSIFVEACKIFIEENNKALLSLKNNPDNKSGQLNDLISNQNKSMLKLKNNNLKEVPFFVLFELDYIKELMKSNDYSFDNSVEDIEVLKNNLLNIDTYVEIYYQKLDCYTRSFFSKALMIYFAIRFKPLGYKNYFMIQ